jgi:hypothetical protein
LNRKLYYKAIALVEKIDYMLQRRQIVVKGLGKKIDIEDPAYIKYTNTTFGFIIWVFLYVDVTIYRTVLLQQYQGTSQCILLTMELGRRNI